MNRVSNKSRFLKALHTCRGIEINKLKRLFSTLDPATYRELLYELEKTRDEEATRLLLYFLFIFRDEKNLRNLGEATEVPQSLFEYYCLFSYKVIRDKSDTYTVFYQMRHLFSQKATLDLILSSPKIARHDVLLYALVILLDAKHLDLLFNNIDDLDSFLAPLCRLPEAVRSSLFEINPHFAGYVSLFVQTCCEVELVELLSQGKEYQEVYSSSSSVEAIEQIRSEFVLTEEQQKTLSERNNKRIIKIAQLIKKSEHRQALFGQMQSDGVIVDELEAKLIEEILDNPLLRGVAS